MSWLALWALLSSPAQAAELWTGAGADARVAQAVSVGVSANWRALTGPFATEQSFGQGGVTFRMHPNFRMSLGYRAGMRNDDPSPFFRHRVQVDAAPRWRIGEFRFQLRERYQVRLRSAGKDTRHTLRTRIKTTADFDLPVRLGLSAEGFVNLGDGDGSGDGVGLDKVRLGVLLRVPVEDLDIDLAYYPEVPVRDAVGSHILSLGLTYQLDFRPD
ncbi:MAG: DUF2490 domain-containing protein [Proteobacteria bacterium]|nr:DUF2490 domain-containing protein [Pseudomonadota bacterium]